MNAHGIEIGALVKGDVIVVADLPNGGTRDREVVRVIDRDGARGGIVDTKPVGGRYSRSNGFVLGDEIVSVKRMAGIR